MTALHQPRRVGVSPLPLLKQHRSSKQPRFLVLPPPHRGLGLLQQMGWPWQRVTCQGGNHGGLRNNTILMKHIFFGHLELYNSP